MRVCVTLEFRFQQLADGSVWTPGSFAYPFWERYLEVFDTVQVIARVRRVSSVPSDWKRADGRQVSFAPIPDYHGPLQFLMQSPQVIRAVRQAITSDDAVILRVGSQLAACVEPVLTQTGQPFGVEVVGDPYDAFSPKAIRHPLRPFFRWWFTREQQRQCRNAWAVSYVTRYYLQQRYPNGIHGIQAFYSDVELTPDRFVTRETVTGRYSERRFEGDREYRLITLASLEQMYKAPDVLIDACALCLQAGYNLRLVICGDGKYRSSLEALARKREIANRVEFRGHVAGFAAVAGELDQSDVFVLPSRTEGLPRALIEAMARGLPCIGSNVGGIPELLPEHCLVPAGDTLALAHRISEFLDQPEVMLSAALRNLDQAHEYEEAKLHHARLEYYRAVRETTEAWVAAKVFLKKNSLKSDQVFEIQ
ncbi:MAG TPA: glycosyltransferase family 4 protein [Acidobacteriota bacterium]|nr:glycosyltransferase family 4 protein [Acidobacteriota bacterium]HND18328.1 glycosyltransferase family 4 protein [Acidobacteriota bacterium]HNG92284.1 glycosyltransferase family 4 protein [Acidobacteriota bacterium]HNH81740.1 glycosyltransferase family 4 protein [Acidobacteriota bacterium]HNJ41755.1 glycosyltransferase family 4 protein [Acidobacteriota bacterium]